MPPRENITNRETNHSRIDKKYSYWLLLFVRLMLIRKLESERNHMIPAFSFSVYAIKL